MKKLELNIQRFASGSNEYYNGNMGILVNWSSSVIGSTPEEKAQNNKSNVSATVYVRRTDGYTTTGNFTGHVNIDGSTYGFNTYASVGSGWTLLGSGSKQVSHNTDGSKSIYIGGTVTGPTETSWEGKTTSGGTTATLDKINRIAITNSVTGSNIEENFNVNYTKYVTSYDYKLNIKDDTTLETIDYNTSGANFTLSQNTIDTLFDKYGPLATFNLKFAVGTWDGSTKLSDGNEITQSCITDSKGRIRINGEWKNASPYVRVNGEWKKTTPHIRINNEWKRGK